ncbi:germination protein YpeB [Clostridiaceae bacterium M8S5]|nr:germination protein YpeB [Clostridiaceae bacterium M8S5]
MKFKRYGAITIVLSLLLVISIGWGYTQYREKLKFKRGLNSQYQRYFYDMKDNIETVQTSLEKSLLSESKERNILLLSQIYHQASFAHDKLTQLPLRHGELKNTEKFLNHVADYSYSLIQDHINEKELDDKQRQTLFKLQDYLSTFTRELEDTFIKIANGDIDFSTVQYNDKEIKKANKVMLHSGMSKYEEEQMTEYPELIYDGPFSDQILNMKPRGLGSGAIDIKKAEEIAKTFLKYKNISKIEPLEMGDELKSVSIPAYTFDITLKDESKTYIGISRVGGKVIWMEHSRKAEKHAIAAEDAKQIGRQFLKEKGYESMEANYMQEYQDYVLINYAYKQGDITVYSDLIKVKVALDNGEIIGMDASNYLKSHHKRDIEKPKLSKEQAREKVRYSFDISKSRLTIIPDRGAKDVLCYEFKGEYKGFDYIVYINANTGREEKILKVIITDNGVLMM